MELKLSGNENIIICIFSSNRTFMELKFKIVHHGINTTQF